MSERLRLAVCIPIYNGASTLPTTLESVLTQTRAPDQVVVVDDGSNDESLQIAKTMMPHAEIIAFSSNRGAAASWNAAVTATSCEWVKLLCQDDILRPNALERQLQIAASLPSSAVMVASRRRIVDERGRQLMKARGLGRLQGHQTGQAARDEVLRTGSNIIGEPSAVLFRRDAYDRTSGFDPDAAYTIDLDFWLRLMRVGSVWCDPEPACDFRVSAGQWSVRLADQQAAEMQRLLSRLAEEDGSNGVPISSRLRNRLDVKLRRTLYWWLGVRRYWQDEPDHQPDHSPR